MTRSGDALALKVAETLLAREGTGPALGIEIETVREGYARVAMMVRADMLNGHRIAHGGFIFILADTAFAYACNSRNQAAVAQQISISFLRPAALGERLIAEARETAVVGRSGSYHLSVRKDNGEIIAEAIGVSRLKGSAVIHSDS